MSHVILNATSGALALLGVYMVVCGFAYLKRGIQGRGAAHKVQA